MVNRFQELLSNPFLRTSDVRETVPGNGSPDERAGGNRARSVIAQPTKLHMQLDVIRGQVTLPEYGLISAEPHVG